MTKPELLQFLTTKVAKWWLPDDIVFVDSILKVQLTPACQLCAC